MRVVPRIELTVSFGLNANSAMFDLASTIAPAALMRLTRNASLSETKPLSDERAVRALQADRLEVVLDDRRHAVERAREPAARELPVERVGFLQRVGIRERRWR